MKKSLLYTLFLASGLFAACQSIDISSPGADDCKVTVDIQLTAPESAYGTKTLGETSDLTANGLYVAVYEAGYRCEVVQANNLTHVSGNEYTFSLTLTTSENARNLHFISIGGGLDVSGIPFEESRLGSEYMTSNGVDAYWQEVKLANIPNSASALKGLIGDIVLIRNFAKITMTSTASNFSLTSFKVFNTPNYSFVAPYIASGSNTGFVTGYNALSYAAARLAYPGRMPASPGLKEFTSSYEGGTGFITTATDTETGLKTGVEYVYERPVATEDNAPYIIVKGVYSKTGQADVTCYYKVNLMDEDGNYYPLLRGFNFQVNINSVIDAGFSTAALAAASAGTGNISTNMQYQNVTNISDGNARMFVSEIVHTCVRESTFELKYQFRPDAGSTTSLNTILADFAGSTSTQGVGVFVSDNSETALKALSSVKVKTSNGYEALGSITGTIVTDAEGYATLQVTTTDPNSIYKEATITIKGRGINTRGGQTYTSVVQRDIKIIVRPVFTFATSANNKGTTNDGKIGDEIDLTITLDSGLPQTIFPIQFKIEAKKLTLAPQKNQQLPVESGYSTDPAIYPNNREAAESTKRPSFYYVKTINWEDYDDEVPNSYVCKFVANNNDYATDIFVSSELFTTMTIHLTKANGSVTGETGGSDPEEEP